MAYTGNPATVPADAVRFYVGDTDTANPLLLDGEVTFLLTEYGGVLSAAVVACESIAAKLSRKVDKAVGPVRLSLSQQAKAFADRAIELRARLALGATPLQGGRLVADTDSLAADESAVQPSFTRDGQLPDNDQPSGWRNYWPYP